MTWSTWQACALGSALFAGLTAIFGKLGVAGIDPDFATMLRTFVILALSCAIVLTRGARLPEGGLGLRSAVFIVLSALCTGISWLFYYRALQSGPASRVAAIDKLSVAFVLAFAVLFLGERPSLRTGVGCLLVAAGSWLAAGG